MLETPSSPSPTQAQRADKHVLYERAVQHPPATSRSSSARSAPTTTALRTSCARTSAAPPRCAAAWVAGRRRESRATASTSTPIRSTWGTPEHRASRAPARLAERVTLLAARRARGEARVRGRRVGGLQLLLLHLPGAQGPGQLLPSAALESLRPRGTPRGSTSTAAPTRCARWRDARATTSFDLRLGPGRVRSDHAPRVTLHIHFEFPDGSRIERAFGYHWRLWQIPELHDLLPRRDSSRASSTGKAPTTRAARATASTGPRARATTRPPTSAISWRSSRGAFPLQRQREVLDQRSGNRWLPTERPPYVSLAKIIDRSRVSPTSCSPNMR